MFAFELLKHLRRSSQPPSKPHKVCGLNCSEFKSQTFQTYQSASTMFKAREPHKSAFKHRRTISGKCCFSVRSSHCKPVPSSSGLLLFVYLDSACLASVQLPNFGRRKRHFCSLHNRVIFFCLPSMCHRCAVAVLRSPNLGVLTYELYLRILFKVIGLVFSEMK